MQKFSFTIVGFAVASYASALPNWDFTGYQVGRSAVQVVSGAYGVLSSQVETKTGLTPGVDPNFIQASAFGSASQLTSTGGFIFGDVRVETNLSLNDGRITYGGPVTRTGTAGLTWSQTIDLSVIATSDLDVVLNANPFTVFKTSLFVNDVELSRSNDGGYNTTIRAGDVLRLNYQNYGPTVESSALALTPVPEPITLASLSFGVALLARRRRG